MIEITFFRCQSYTRLLQYNCITHVNFLLYRRAGWNCANRFCLCKLWSVHKRGNCQRSVRAFETLLSQRRFSSEQPHKCCFAVSTIRHACLSVSYACRWRSIICNRCSLIGPNSSRSPAPSSTQIRVSAGFRVTVDDGNVGSAQGPRTISRSPISTILWKPSLKLPVMMAVASCQTCNLGLTSSVLILPPFCS